LLAFLQPCSSYSLNIERVTAITDKKTISSKPNGSEVFPHETKAINTRTEVGPAARPDPD